MGVMVAFGVTTETGPPSTDLAVWLDVIRHGHDDWSIEFSKSGIYIAKLEATNGA